MRLVLEVISGPATGKTVEVCLGQVVSVGRTRKANITLGDNFMSGTHFAVKCDSLGCRLEDLKSRNGTKLNGELVLEAPLKNGDRVFAGSTDFVVRIYEEPTPAIAPEQISDKPSIGAARKTSSRRKSGRLSADSKDSSKIASPQPSAPKTQQPSPAVERKNSSKALPPTAVKPINEPQTREVARKSKGSAPATGVPLSALNSYEAATPDGRLLKILSSQPQALMALIDAAHDAAVLELLRATQEQFQSLYRPEQKAAIAPYLVRVPSGSDLLKQMIRRGWGQGWGVYLTCSLSLPELRDYFRSSLMVSLPDGMELFSRFYDPRFFRGFLGDCTAKEAEKFFGPITSYFMEDERSEILLQFTMGQRGVEKRGHLLSDLS